METSRSATEGVDIVLQSKDHPALTVEFNRRLDKAAYADGHEMYMKSLQKALERAGTEHEEREAYYKANKSKIRNIALGQCNEGILSLIQQHTEYEANKLDLF